MEQGWGGRSGQSSGTDHAGPPESVQASGFFSNSDEKPLGSVRQKNDSTNFIKPLLAYFSIVLLSTS